MTALASLLLKLAAIALPLAALAWGLRIYPRPPLVALALVPAAGLAGALLVRPAFVLADRRLGRWRWIAGGGADLLHAAGARKAFSVEREPGWSPRCGKRIRCR